MEQKKKLINAYGIAIPRVHALYGSITGFEVQGRRLYPAVEAARLFGYSFPNVAGSQCGRKELWNVEMTVSRADREKTFTTIVEKKLYSRRRRPENGPTQQAPGRGCDIGLDPGRRKRE